MLRVSTSNADVTLKPDVKADSIIVPLREDVASASKQTTLYRIRPLGADSANKGKIPEDDGEDYCDLSTSNSPIKVDYASEQSIQSAFKDSGCIVA